MYGLLGAAINDIVNATTVAWMLYVATVWWGFIGGEGVHVFR